MRTNARTRDKEATLATHIRDLRQLAASLERKVARLEAKNPQTEQEKEIARLEQRVIDVEDRWEEAEAEVCQLRKLVHCQACERITV